MNLLSPTQQPSNIVPSRSPLQIPDGARILIVCNDSSESERLQAIVQEAGFVSDCASSVAQGCEVAKSGKFQVVISTPFLPDGSWKRLDDIAYHYDLAFEVVLCTHDMDIAERVRVLDDGAFDTLALEHDSSEALQTIKRALWAAYLKGAGPNPGLNDSQRAA